MPDNLKVLMVGDVVGSLGRKSLAHFLPQIQAEEQPDLVVVNVENISHGKGVMRNHYRFVEDLGVDIMTSGNHIWSKDEGVELLSDSGTKLLRPANYPASNPGSGYQLVEVGDQVCLVINLQGQVFMKSAVDSPFKIFDQIYQQFEGQELAAVIVDFHAEATSEKIAFSQYVSGRATVVVGTHTHVPTADQRLLSGSTAAVTDVGMTGFADGVLGVESENIIQAFLTQRSFPHTMTTKGRASFNSVIVELSLGKALNIKRFDRYFDFN